MNILEKCGVAFEYLVGRKGERGMLIDAGMTLAVEAHNSDVRPHSSGLSTERKRKKRGPETEKEEGGVDITRSEGKRKK